MSYSPFSDIQTAELRLQGFQAEAARWHTIRQATGSPFTTRTARRSSISNVRQTAGATLIKVGERLRGLPQAEGTQAGLPALR
jgi:hypothetical protein